MLVRAVLPLALALSLAACEASSGTSDNDAPATPAGPDQGMAAATTPAGASPGASANDAAGQPSDPATTPTDGVVPGDGDGPASTTGDDDPAGSGDGDGSAGAESAPPATLEPTLATLYWLDITGNGVMRSDARDFGDGARIANTNTAPDGVAVDVAGGKVYWSNMGSLLGTGGGTLQRANLDGSGVETIVASGMARTPKQIQLDRINRQVYWCDREGAKVWRVGFEGGTAEILVSEHGFEQLVGVALDVEARKVYFSDRIGRKILRMGFDMPDGETHATRGDVEELLAFGAGAMPIDLDLDLEARQLYWTDRQLGTVHRAGMELPAGQTPATRDDVETLVEGLVDAIGLSLNMEDGTMFYSELGGRVWQANLDGSDARTVATSGSATGVALAHLPAP